MPENFAAAPQDQWPTITPFFDKLTHIGNSALAQKGQLTKQEAFALLVITFAIHVKEIADYNAFHRSNKRAAHQGLRADNTNIGAPPETTELGAPSRPGIRPQAPAHTLG